MYRRSDTYMVFKGQVFLDITCNDSESLAKRLEKSIEVHMHANKEKYKLEKITRMDVHQVVPRGDGQYLVAYNLYGYLYR